MFAPHIPANKTTHSRGRRLLAWGLFFGLFISGVRADDPPPAFILEEGEAATLIGNYTFSHMIIHGELTLAGDTQVTLVGPEISGDPSIPAGNVMYVHYSGRIEGAVADGAAGQHAEQHQSPSGRSGTSGRDADPDGAWGATAGTDGGPGLDGHHGLDGGAGESAPAFIVYARAGGAYIRGAISLAGAKGGNGGIGGDAQGGGWGGHGGVDQNGADKAGGKGSIGGIGGNGGHGGDGGAGGTFKLIAAGDVTLSSYVDVSGGDAGVGRTAGEGGSGGSGGDSGDGQAGQGGDGSRSGQPGNGGRGGRGGLIDLHSEGDLLFLGSRTSLYSYGGNGGGRGGNGGGGGSGGRNGRFLNDELNWEPRPGGGIGLNLPDSGGHAGRGGHGGTIRLAAQGSVKPAYEGQGYMLISKAYGGSGGRPLFPAEPTWTRGNERLPPNDGVVPGGDGGDGGRIEAKARGMVELQATAAAGAGNRGSYGQFVQGVAAANGGPGGNGGTGGTISITAPTILADLDDDLDVNGIADAIQGGSPGAGGFPGGQGDSIGPYGEFGPDGTTGADGEVTNSASDPVLFPRTSELIVTSDPSDQATLGETVQYEFTFTNNDAFSAVEDLQIEVIWTTPPAIEPVEADLDAVSNTNGFVATPPDLDPGESLTWIFSARVLGPFKEGSIMNTEVLISGSIANNAGEDSTAISLVVVPGPEHDSDGDGVSDADEDIAGTDPKDGSSVFRVEGFVIDGASIQITAQTLATRDYVLERNLDLDGDTWVPVTDPVRGNGGQMTFTNPAGEEDDKRFYRVRVSVPAAP